MAKVIVLYTDGQNVPYESMDGCYTEDGVLHIRFPDGSITFVAPGQWKTAEYWVDEDDE